MEESKIKIKKYHIIQHRRSIGDFAGGQYLDLSYEKKKVSKRRVKQRE